MKKGIKIISDVVLYLALAMFLISLLIAGIINDRAESSFLSVIFVIPMEIFAAVTGILLINTKNEIVCKVGHGLAISAFAIVFSCGLINIEDSICAILMVVAGSLLMLYYILLLVAIFLSKKEDSKIIQIRKWKQLFDEGIISGEEFEAKRAKILNLNNENK